MAFILPKSLIVLLVGLLISGCATTSGKLNRSQIAMLNQQGFVQTEQGWAFGLSDKLLFPLDESRVIPEQRPVVTRITQALLSVGITRVSVEGHTDNTGTNRHNLELSHKRASAVADLMKQAGMQPENIRVAGLGAFYPIASNDTEAGRQENRRVVLIVEN